MKKKKNGSHRWLLILVSRSPLAFFSHHSNFATMQDIKFNVEDMMYSKLIKKICMAFKNCILSHLTLNQRSHSHEAVSHGL